MKVERCLNKIIVYIYNNKYFDKKIYDMIKQVLSDLKEYYYIEYYSAYNIKLYANKNYGIILEIENNGNIADTTININLKILRDSLFLYQIQDPLNFFDNELYYYDDKFFINVKNNNIRLTEFTNIIYSEDVYKIIGKGIKIT